MYFLKAGGVPALSAVLNSQQPTPSVIRYTLCALEALTASCPAASCEAILGWWRPNSDQPIDQDAFNDDEEGNEQEEADNNGEEHEDVQNGYYGVCSSQ